MKKNSRTFASDNYSTVHPTVMRFLNKMNGHAPGYGNDDMTRRARGLLTEQFKNTLGVLFVPTGTGANILALRLLLEKPYEAIVTSQISHIFEEETGALASFVGAQIFTVAHTNGKVSTEDLQNDIELRKSLEFHSALPKVVSITSTTEYGTYYTIDEIKQISSYCHANGMYLHVDGCRLSNAVAAIGCTLTAYTKDTGIDILSFGGAKNGLMSAEAIIIFNAPKSDLLRMQKQSLQLVSKMRYVAGQFIPYMENDLWLVNAKKANDLTALLAKKLLKLLGDSVVFTQPVSTNQLFCILPPVIIKGLRAAGHQFYDWNSPNEVRFVLSWDNTKNDVNDIVSLVKAIKNG